MTDNKNDRQGPALLPGLLLLGGAAVLMVVVLIKPQMSSGPRTAIAIAAVLVVIALVVYAFRMWLSIQKRGGGK